MYIVGSSKMARSSLLFVILTIIVLNAAVPLLPTAITAFAGHGVVPSPKIDDAVLNEVRSKGVATFMVILKEPDWEAVHEVSLSRGHDAVVAYLRKYAETQQRSVESLSARPAAIYCAGSGS